MPHNLVIGGQPDYLAYFYENLGFSWLIHGREITAGDAEKTLDRTPSVRYRAKSPMSGELYFKGQYGNFGGSPRDRSIAGIVHNLADIGARVRVIVGSTAQITNTFPTSTVEQDNTTSVFGDVDQETYGAMSTWAIPTVAATAWHLEVGFANATALQINVEDSQVILVRVRYRGTPGSGGVSLLIEAKEDDGLGTPDDFPVRASKELSILADAENDEYIISLLVDPNDFVDPTMDDLTVRVTIDGILGEGNYFEIGSIMWQKVVASSLDVDTGWTDVESSSLHLEFLDPPHVAPQLCSILPYLDSSGELILAIDTATYFLFTWDDSGTVGQGGIKERIFDQSSSGDNALTLWRPEIGVLVEGPAFGTALLQPQYTAGISDPSDVRRSKGGNDWFRRKPPRRTLSLDIKDIAADDAMSKLYHLWRRVGITRPYLIAVTPGEDFSSEVAAALSMYARITDFSLTQVQAAVDGYAEAFEARLSLEEVV